MRDLGVRDRQVLSGPGAGSRVRPASVAWDCLASLPEGPVSVLGRRLQETLQLFLGQRLGGLWGGRVAFTLRRPLLLWVALVVRE